ADLMVACDNLLHHYDGDLVVMHDSSKDAKEFEKRLRGLKAYPSESADLFMRELRGCLKYVDPVPEKEVVKAAKDFKLTERRSGRPVLTDLEKFWKKKNFAKKKFRNFETALYWHGKHLGA
ncbi:MAG: hypothetical protein GOV15_00515, partial [Candidatus Diapherotrites archaeon]|nr:hypothetical protein [Candidatus Diapherotrites archaeon]